VAATRHLLSRKTHIILAEAQYESSDTQDVQMKTQTAILKRMAKAGAHIRRGPWRRASNYIKNLPSPPAVIIDGLLAGSTYESLLDSSNSQHAAEAQKEAREMIEWANRSRAPVLSIACPSGVSGLDGSTTTLEGEPLAVRPDKVLCFAAPIQGIFDALKGGEKWDVSLADIGINIALRSDEAVAFGGRWVVDLRFVEDEVLLG
jgi:enhancer of mRNA-decapping protein 3